MPKKKKTRKQKLLADVRQQTEPQVARTATTYTIPEARGDEKPASSPKVSRQEKPTQPSAIMTSGYPYLVKDLWKTLILTCVIIGLELLLKFGTGI